MSAGRELRRGGCSEGRAGVSRGEGRGAEGGSGGRGGTDVSAGEGMEWSPSSPGLSPSFLHPLHPPLHPVPLPPQFQGPVLLPQRCAKRWLNQLHKSLKPFMLLTPVHLAHILLLSSPCSPPPSSKAPACSLGIAPKDCRTSFKKASCSPCLLPLFTCLTLPSPFPPPLAPFPPVPRPRPSPLALRQKMAEPSV